MSPLGFKGKERAMDEKTYNTDEAIKQLENADVTELDDENLEDVAGGAPPNTNCGNSNCCQKPNPT